MPGLGFISMPGGSEWLVIGFVGLLLFGKRLPEVARSLGQSVVEFKKGLSSFETEFHRGTSESPDLSAIQPAEHRTPEFSPPAESVQPAKPLPQAADAPATLEQGVPETPGVQASHVA